MLGLNHSQLLSFDLRQWLLAIAAGFLSQIVLYTLWGLGMANIHAFQMMQEMALYQQFGMLPLIQPDDPYLASWLHRLASGSFFGLTLGMLSGAMGALFSIGFLLPADRFVVSGRLIRLVHAALMLIMSWHSSLFWVSLIFAVLAQLTFFAAFNAVMRFARPRQIYLRRWLIVMLLFCLPAVALGPRSFFQVRDAMLDLPIMAALNDFYYDHTLLAADIIKPLASRTQNAIQIEAQASDVRLRPNGVLIMLGESVPPGTTIRLGDQGPGQIKLQAEIKDYSAKHDDTLALRRGIGLGLFVAIACGLVVFALLALLLAQLRNPYAVALIMVAYMLLWLPSLRSNLWQVELQRDPSKLSEYIASEHNQKRYLASLASGLSFEQVSRLANDNQSRTRLNALISAGKSQDSRYLPLVLAALDDPQLNVRTKACWALGRIGGEDAHLALNRVIRDDPNWYVRDYAYRAIGRIRPIHKIVKVSS